MAKTKHITTYVKNMHLHRDSNPGPWNTVPMLRPLSYEDTQCRNMLLTYKHQRVIVGDRQVSTKTRRPWHQYNTTYVKNMHLHRDSNPGPWNTVPMLRPLSYEDTQCRNMLLTYKHQRVIVGDRQVSTKTRRPWHQYNTTYVKNMHLHRDSNPGPWNTVPMLRPLSYEDTQCRNMLLTYKHQRVIVGDRQVSTKTRRPWHQYNTTYVKNMHLHRDSNPGPWNTVPMLRPLSYEDTQCRNMLLTYKHQRVIVGDRQVSTKTRRPWHQYNTTYVKNMHLHRDSNPGPWNTVPMLRPLSYEDTQCRNMLLTYKHQRVIVGDRQVSTKTRRPWHQYNTTYVKNMHLHRDSNPGPWNTVPMLHDIHVEKTYSPRSSLFSSEVTFTSDQNIIKNRLGLKSCKILKQVSKFCATSSWALFPLFLHATSKTSVFLTCKHNLINRLYRNFNTKQSHLNPPQEKVCYLI